MRRTASLLVFTMLLGGCSSWTAIKPTELPKLNNAQTAVSENKSGQVELISATQVETPDGRLVEIGGKNDARVQLKDASSSLFEYPLRFSVENQALTIMSSNQPKTTIPLEKIQMVEVSQINHQAGEAVFFILSVVSTIGIGFLIASAVK